MRRNNSGGFAQDMIASFAALGPPPCSRCGHVHAARVSRKLQARIEAALGCKLVRGWHLDGPGPARFGWAAVYPCRTRYLGPSLACVKVVSL